ncbi:hypothetical protein [Actinomadura madurae]|uniref:hypothetical protein n=1 Tax=Actinomadura madurae TaxID=1993 RepID=UPI0020D1FC49|nr:hypothetical protein [Actinomadura madurae]MCQ0010227.1 hypothetical protein [Actinomadura madurae]MCQ0014460.1 hypothetical protein [Actinomadura madurae]
MRLWSRLERLGDAFPEVVLAVFDMSPPGTVVDGEIVRCGQPGAEEPIRYIRAVPDVVVEISGDAAVEHGRWRHAVRFVRLRRDPVVGRRT